jgi:hypothetical protein
MVRGGGVHLLLLWEEEKARWVQHLLLPLQHLHCPKYATAKNAKPNSKLPRFAPQHHAKSFQQQQQRQPLQVRVDVTSNSNSNSRDLCPCRSTLTSGPTPPPPIRRPRSPPSATPSPSASPPCRPPPPPPRFPRPPRRPPVALLRSGRCSERCCRGKGRGGLLASHPLREVVQRLPLPMGLAGGAPMRAAQLTLLEGNAHRWR